MTAPTTRTPAPTGISQVPEPCWTVAMADGIQFSTGGEWEPGCWSTQLAAELGLAGLVSDDRPAVFMEVRQHDFRCWRMVMACGTEFVYDAEVEQTHFEDRAGLLAAMVEEKVAQLDGVDQYAMAECCTECKTAITGQALEPEPEPHPDQVPLIPGPGDTIPKGWTL